MTLVKLPPGPGKPMTLAELREHNPLEVFPRLVREHGNVVYWIQDGAPTVLLNEPRLIEQVMVKDHARMTKGSLWWIRAVMGEGVGVSEGAVHRRQRKMMAAAFTPRAVQAYAPDIVELGRTHAESWQSGVRRVPGLLGELTLAVVHRTLLGCELDSEEAVEIREAFKIAQKSSGLMAPTQDQVPAEALAEFQAAMARLDEALIRLLRARRDKRGNDLLSRLMALRDDQQQEFTERELRDQAMSIMLAGHDTTADSLAWALHLLARHPDVQDRAFREAEALGADPTVEDLPRLDLCRRIFAEGMRLYPPIWMISRRVMEPYELGSYRLEGGTYLRMSPYITHRDPRFFPEPERFDPQRWLPEAVAARPRLSYFPFGGGDRVCLGEPMAWMEAPLLLAVILRRWFVHPAGSVTPLAYITLSAHNLHLRFERR